MPHTDANHTQAIMTAIPVLVGRAEPSISSGIYVFSYQGRDSYVGQAKGSKGLRDRILSKHVSGDESHALQRSFKDDFPDRDLRRAHIRKTVSVRWAEVPADEVSVVERTLIKRFAPECNYSQLRTAPAGQAGGRNRKTRGRVVLTLTTDLNSSSAGRLAQVRVLPAFHNAAYPSVKAKP